MGNCVMLCCGSGDEKKKKRKRNTEVDVSFGSSRKPLLDENPNTKEEEVKGGGHEKERVVRVKVLLTKGEVEKLLAMGINDSEKMLQYLANELGRLDTDGIVGISNDNGKNRSDVGVWKPVLESIPEIV